jgi:hypothetical protein
VIQIVGDVQVTWAVTNSYGSAITAYKIEFKHYDGVNYNEVLAYCDGTSATIVASRQCIVPMSVFTASPFYLQAGSPIYVRVSAKNGVGVFNIPSSDNIIYALA